MRRSSIYTSAAFHGIILIIAIMGLPFLSHRVLVIPQPITVDLIEISKVTETNRVTPLPVPPPPKPEPPKPQPAPVNTSPQPVVPVKEPPKPEEKVVKPTKAAAVDENALPDKTNKKEIKKPEPKKLSPQDFAASVLKNLGPTKEPSPPSPGQNTPIGAKMTMSEEDALRSQLEQCWNPPIGAKDVENMTVEIFMVIRPDRTLQEAHIVDTMRYNSDSFFQAVADSALRAVESPSCSPFDLPPDKFNTWNHTTVNFSPKDMF